MSVVAETELEHEEGSELEDENEDENEDEAPMEDENEAGHESEQAELEPEALAAIGPDEIRKAERARDTNRKRLAGILGADYVAHECLFCSGLGFAPELPPVGAKFHIVPTAEGVGFEVEPPSEDLPLLSAPDKALCPECDGWGEVLTGSKAAHAMVAPCSKCAGNGWIMVSREPIAPLDFSSSSANSGTATAAMTGPGAPDAWGRPSGHQHWGIPPASVPG